MWWQWVKSTIKVHDDRSPTTAVSSTGAVVIAGPKFTCSSFKDIQLLCKDDPPRLSSTKTSTSTVFRRVRLANSILRTWSTHPEPPKPNPRISLPGSENSIVIYFTSLRVIRSTFEDCKSTLSILRSFRVKIDERDLSMDSSFAVELQQILGAPPKSKPKLPIVFIHGIYIGGADRIEELHEIGELKKLVAGLSAAKSSVCDICGDYRYVVCGECDGSHKVYTEKWGIKFCSICDENGLVRCNFC